LGVVTASVIPSWLGLHVLVSVMVLLMALALWAWWEAPRPMPSLEGAAGWRLLLQPWGHAGFKRLLLVFLTNGIASAIPATLILFFVQDRCGGCGVVSLVAAPDCALGLAAQLVGRHGFGSGRVCLDAGLGPG
jgi:hypothetical protein